MMEDVARLAFIVQVSSEDEDLLNSFGYKVEKELREDLCRRIMVAVAKHPHIMGVEVFPVQELAQMIEQIETEEMNSDEE